VRKLAVLLLLWFTVAAGGAPSAQNSSLPDRPGALKFAVIGDTGTGGRTQYEVAQQMMAARTRFPFNLVIMLGDNIYGKQDFVEKFEKPYAPLLEAGVKFFATLGNHDSPSNRDYKGFNMEGRRYFTFTRNNTQFFVLDSNAVEAAQLDWFEGALKASGDNWKIVYFHHPLYSNAGRHGSDVRLRVALEPIMVRYGVSVVFSGHDHTYERLKPQKGITYFVEGSSGQLAPGDLRQADSTAVGFDRDQTFMLVEIAGDQMSFETLTRSGQRVDSGVINRRTSE
jgi:3',5'-cyclic AMP phosphodiesterase CpdA